MKFRKTTVTTIVTFGFFVCLSANAQNRRRSDTESLNQSRTSIIDPIDVPGSLAELVAMSPFIVIGICEGELSAKVFEKSDPKSDVVTERIVRVTEVLRGNLAQQKQIAIDELGGAFHDGIRNINQAIVHHQPLKPGDKYLLFIRPISEVANDSFDGRRFSITGVWAGSFHLVNGNVHLSSGVQPGLLKLDGQVEAAVLGLVKTAVLSARQ